VIPERGLGPALRQVELDEDIAGRSDRRHPVAALRRRLIELEVHVGCAVRRLDSFPGEVQEVSTRDFFIGDVEVSALKLAPLSTGPRVVYEV